MCKTRSFLILPGVIGIYFASHSHAQETGETVRAIVGFEQAGASSASSVQRFFGDLYVSVPFPWARQSAPNPPPAFSFGPRIRIFANTRITTVPQQITSGIGTFAAQFPQTLAAIKVNEVAQATEFLAGTEIRLVGLKTPLKAFDGSTFQRFTLNLIVQAGATTPLTPRDSLELFDIRPGTLNPDERKRLETSYPQTRGAEFAAFTIQDRDRFFRQYYGGFRLKTYYFEESNGTAGRALARFPSVVDLTIGGNEAVTGGRFHGTVLRLDGFQSIPVEGWAGSIFVFGTFMLKPVKTNINDPLLLRPSSICSGSASTPSAPCTFVPSSNVAMVFTPQFNRDYYRIGVGVELLSVVKELRRKGAPRVN